MVGLYPEDISTQPHIVASQNTVTFMFSELETITIKLRLDSRLLDRNSNAVSPEYKLTGYAEVRFLLNGRTCTKSGMAHNEDVREAMIMCSPSPMAENYRQKLIEYVQ
jgi:hypothetical protein